ncbi:hypothetical protein L4C34_01645 [Vibrio profundum]|uniref:hypothetical protein n=1 Tax=Vibrio profundum TaxID=2910247 RepID=UPI003D12EF15
MKKAVVVTSLMAMSCFGAHASTSESATPTILTQSDAPSVLGSGYSSLMQMSRISCYKPTNVYTAGGAKSVLELSNNTTYDDIQKQLHINVKAHGGIGPFSGKGSADYLRTTRDTRYSQSFYYKAGITFPMESFMPTKTGKDGLTPMGQAALAAGPEKFVALCGDQFVQGVVPGANLIFTLKLDFATTTDKSNFNSSVSGSWGLNGASDAIQKIVNEKHIKGSLSLLAYQEGGDPTQLAKIFSRKDAKGHYYALTCSLDDLNSCTGTIDGFIDYAKNNFPDQLNYQDGTVVGNAYPIDFHHENYSTYKVDIAQTPANEETITARNKLGDLLYQTENNIDFVDRYLNSIVAPYFSVDAKDKLESISHASHNNLALLNSPYDGAIQCYLNPEQCVDIENNIDASLSPVDQETIDYFKNTMWQVNADEEKYFPIDLKGHFAQIIDNSEFVLISHILLDESKTHLTMNTQSLGVLSYTSYEPGLSFTANGDYYGKVKQCFFGCTDLYQHITMHINEL